VQTGTFANAHKKQFPQTGDRQDGLFSMLGISLLALIGLTWPGRKRKGD
jgi:LPXTG-motif cell wall-anchored protein